MILTQNCFRAEGLAAVETLAEELRQAWIAGRHVDICGNGGSAANAMHLDSDFHYGIGACGPGPSLPGLRGEALTDNIYVHQLQVKGRRGDLLIVLSGSGNSPNVVLALETAAAMGI